jgi:uncharacterized membrane protein
MKGGGDLVVPLVSARTARQVSREPTTRLRTWLDVWAFSGDAGAARTILEAVASSLIAVTSLTL